VNQPITAGSGKNGNYSKNNDPKEPKLCDFSYKFMTKPLIHYNTMDFASAALPTFFLEIFGVGPMVHSGFLSLILPNAKRSK